MGKGVSSGEGVKENSSSPPATTTQQSCRRRRRNKRDRQESWSKHISSLQEPHQYNTATNNKRIIKKKKRSKMTSKHADDANSGGMNALLPSIIGLIILSFMIMAKLGFRGRATTCGIDLGTTNSVVCVQQPPKSSASWFTGSGSSKSMSSTRNNNKGMGEIICIPDPSTNSPIIPSVVSFLDHHYLRSFRLTKEEKQMHDEKLPSLVSTRHLRPHPVDVLVGQNAKERINSHPHHTIYHAKRIIGREYEHESVHSMSGEVEFDIVSSSDKEGMASFSFPYHMPPSSSEIANDGTSSSSLLSSAVLSPSEIGSYVIHHLRTITRSYLQHDNVQSVVIAIPAKFEPSQRDATIHAFELAGLKVVRIIEEPTAAALAYGLHKQKDVHYVMVYDFGGGTLDISLLYISEGGYIEVLGSDGDEQLGGADFDAAIAHWLLEKKGGDKIVRDIMSSIVQIEEQVMMVSSSNTMNNSNNDVEDLIEELCPKLKDMPLCTISSIHTIGEKLKIDLSNHPNELDAVAEGSCYRLPADIEVIPNTVEKLCESIYQVNLSLSLHEYDTAVDHLYKRSLLPIRRLLKDLNLQKEEVDEVVMVGGTTRMPQVRELVRKELDKERLNTHIDPDLTVAYGAASVID